MVPLEVRDSRLFSDPRNASVIDHIDSFELNEIRRKLGGIDQEIALSLREVKRESENSEAITPNGPLTEIEFRNIAEARIRDIFDHFRQEYGEIGEGYPKHGLVLCRCANNQGDHFFWALPVGLDKNNHGWMRGRREELYEVFRTKTNDYPDFLTINNRSRLIDGNPPIVWNIFPDDDPESVIKIEEITQPPHYHNVSFKKPIGGDISSPVRGVFIEFEYIMRNTEGVAELNSGMERRIKIPHQSQSLADLDFFGHMCGVPIPDYGKIIEEVRRGNG